MASSKFANEIGRDAPEETLRCLNIILFGESGVGKSAVTNQIFDKTVVRSSNQAMGVTLENTMVTGFLPDYPNIKCNVFDTVGLSESSDGSVPTITAFVQLIKLAYAVPNGINLLICCHAKGRVSTDRFKANYRIFKEELCEDRIPSLLVITHCDNDEPINEWWDTNEQTVREKLSFNFIDGVCVSTLKNRKSTPNEVLQNYRESRKNLIESILKHALKNPVVIDSWSRKVMVAARNFFNQIQGWLPWFRRQALPLRPDLIDMFTSLGFSDDDAKEQTQKLMRELAESDLLAPYQEVKV